MYNWADFVDQTSIKHFEKTTGIKVQYDVFDQNYILETKLISGKSGYDIVAPTSGPYYEKHIRWHLYQPLDKSLLPNFHHIDPTILKLLSAVDPQNRFGVPWMWGTLGIGYNIDMVKSILPDAPINSLEMIFNPEIVSQFASCGVVLMNTLNDVFPSALIYAGYDPNDQSEEGLLAAKRVLMAIRPYIMQFTESKYIDDLANGDACLVLGLSGDISQAKVRAEEAENGIHIGFSTPKEGTQIWIDVLSIPRDAPHPIEAHKLLNFLLEPKIAAQSTNAIGHMNTNAQSIPYLHPSVIHNPILMTPISKFSKPFMVRAPSTQFDRKRSRIWLHVMKGN